MTIQANFPAIKPSLLLDFANTKSLDPRITFTRASTATYYDGVTTAMAEQNLILQSQDFSAWTTSEITTSLNSTAAPDGTTTADTITPSTNVARHTVQQNFSSAGATYVCSIYAKPNGYNRITIREASTSGNGSTFDVSTGTVVANQVSGVGSITSVGNGWYRCSMVATETSGTRTMQVLVNSNSGSGYEAAFAGDGTSGVYLWGAQVEQRSAVSAYTATTTQAITNYIPVLKTAASGVARFDNNPTTGESLGLLIEESRTNICLYSSDLSNAAWTKSNATITADTVVAPDGTLTGDKIVESTGTGLHRVYESVTATAAAYTFTFYAKAAGRNWVYGAFTTGAVQYAYFDLVNGVVGTVDAGITTASISSVGNGWYRCSVTRTATAVTYYPEIGTASSNGVPSFAGDGFSGVFIWGAQLEAGAFATSYIPTVASQVTRSADAASMTGTNFSSWYNQSEGSLYVDMTYDVSATYIPAPRFYASAGANPNSTGFWNSSTTAIQSSIRSNAVDVAGMSKTVTLVGNHKMSMGYKINDAAFTVDNTSPLSTATPATLPLVDSLGIGGVWVPYFQISATVTHIKKIAYYPIRVTNTNLQALTS